MYRIPALALLIFFLLSSCTKIRKFGGFTQGTTYHITYRENASNRYSPQALKEQVDSILADFDQSLSEYVPGSVISRINKNDTSVLVDLYFKEVFNKSREVFDSTDGAFDITVAPLVNAWGFGPETKSETDTAIIDSLLQFVGMNKIQLMNDRVVKENPNVTLDVNAIAQGYSVDVITGFLRNRGLVNYLVEIGGEIRTVGRKSIFKPWKVGVDKPIENPFFETGEFQVILKLQNVSLATSGNYRKFYEKDGVKYGHSINPVSGYPVMDKLLSATIIAPDCMTADAYATACMIMGLEKSETFVENRPDLEAYFIFSGPDGAFKTWYSSGFKNYIFYEEKR